VKLTAEVMRVKLKTAEVEAAKVKLIPVVKVKLIAASWDHLTERPLITQVPDWGLLCVCVRACMRVCVVCMCVWCVCEMGFSQDRVSQAICQG
jgi:hypothetical protein